MNMTTNPVLERFKVPDSRNVTDTILGQVADWFQAIGVRKRDGERLVVFVSTGGTCRCAMAKALTLHLLSKAKQDFRIRVESRASSELSLGSATRATRAAIHEITGADLLLDHRPRRAGPAFLYEADLILAMSRGILDRILSAHHHYPGTHDDRTVIGEEIKRKLFLATEFFGSSGDVTDPYPDDGDDASLKKYEDCARFLSHLISTKQDNLVSFLSATAPNPAMKLPAACGARSLSAIRYMALKGIIPTGGCQCIQGVVVSY